MTVSESATSGRRADGGAGGSGGVAGEVRHMLLPDAGEGLTEAEILTWRVAPGDEVSDGDVVVEIETAKAVVELPCPFSGTVSEVLAAEGATVAVGAPILAVVPAGVPSPAAGPAAGGEPAGGVAVGGVAAGGVAREPRPEQVQATGHGTGRGPGQESGQDAPVGQGTASRTGRQAVLVGYGPRTGEHARRRRRGHRGRRPGPGSTDTGPGSTDPGAANGGTTRALAKPPVRKLARDLGVDLARLQPSGPGGIVTRSDVLGAHEAATVGTAGAAGAAATAGAAGPPGRHPGAAAVPTGVVVAPSGLPAGEPHRIPVRGVRRATAQAMVASAFSAPHVTEWVQVDVTESMALLERLRGRRELRELKLTPLTLVARAVCLAARRTPEANSSWDEQAGEIVVHPHVNLGIAAATERGLVVPVLQGAERLDLAGLARGVAELAETARAGRLTPAQLSGGTLSITNVGVFGVDGGTPILPPGQTVIVSVGQVRRLPWVVDEQVVPRSVTTLAISFDHRVIDGESGSRFLSDVAALLEDPGLALAWG